MKMISVLLLTLLSFGCGGYKSPSSTAPSAGTVPVIMQLVPNSMTAGSPGFTLTVNGSSFNSDAVVNWNGSAQSTTFATGNQLMAMIPAAGIATHGMVAVTVTNPAHPAGGIYGSGGTAAATSMPMPFTVN